MTRDSLVGEGFRSQVLTYMSELVVIAQNIG
jgi:hypothetical protein